MSWRATVVLIVAGLFASSSLARAQAVPPPEHVPQLPDQPLPEWRPPAPTAPHALILGLAPELRRAEKLRNGGLLAASAGLTAVFAGGLFEAWNEQLTTALHSPRDGMYHPEIAEQRGQVSASAIAMLTIGSALTLTGFVLVAVGQTRISRWHHEHPRDQLPPLSGY
jgi:hypothetical protein